MKKRFRVLFLFLFFSLILCIGKTVQANTINKIEMDISIDENGNANIAETWYCYITENTELCHPYTFLGNAKIENISVVESGKTYETVSLWNTSDTLEENAYKCGSRSILNGRAICWGIGSYGSHVYQINYTINNFIANLEDSQMLYCTFIPNELATSIDKVTIKVHSYFAIPESTDVWNFGNKEGTVQINNGSIEMQTNRKLEENESMTLLVKFPSNTFQTSNSLNYDFDHYYQDAKEGTSKNNRKITEFFDTLLALIIFIGILGITNVVIQKSGILFPRTLKLGTKGRLPSDLPYSRDIPCKNDIFRAYYIGYNYHLLRSKTDLFGAIILKWLKDSIIRIEKTDSIFNKQTIILDETNPSLITNAQEKRLFQMLYRASRDGKLESLEFERWCRLSYSRISLWFNRILQEEQQKLVQEGLITVEKVPILSFFGKHRYVATPALKEEAIKLAGFKKFLAEYTAVTDKQPIEVALSEEYLIYAQLFGIAKQVAKDFKALFPETLENPNLDVESYDNDILLLDLYLLLSDFFTKRRKSRNNTLNKNESSVNDNQK